MPDLRQQLQHCCRGRLCLVGIGNPGLGDDAFGVRLAEELAELKLPGTKVLIAATTPEDCLSQLMDGGYDNILFLDAVEFGAAPGTVTLLASTGIKSRFPQISTHKLSLGLLASMIESNTQIKVWLLGVQPASLGPAQICSASTAKAREDSRTPKPCGFTNAHRPRASVSECGPDASGPLSEGHKSSSARALSPAVQASADLLVELLTELLQLNSAEANAHTEPLMEANV